MSIYLHANKQGSITEATDPNGQVVERYRYDEFGKVSVLNAAYAVLPAAVVGNWFLFTGREYDWETGYYHYRARTYDPGTGTFLQEDPLGMQDGINVVAYVQGDPVNFVDPYGTDGITDTLNGIMDFISQNRDLVADLVVDLLGPLEGVLDLLSAVTGKDVTGWLRGGLAAAGPVALGWWARGTALAGAAVKIASGGLRLLSKLKDILKKLEDLVAKFADHAVGVARRAVCPLVGGCFVLGTVVAVVGQGFVPIEHLEVGVTVESALPGAVPGSSLAAAERAVIATWHREYEGALHTLVLEGAGGQGCEVRGTPEHPFWLVDRHVSMPMCEVGVGDLLDGLRGKVQVVDRRVEFVRMAVANLTVDVTHSYRITELGVLVHNGGKYKRNDRKPMEQLEGIEDRQQRQRAQRISDSHEWEVGEQRPKSNSIRSIKRSQYRGKLNNFMDPDSDG